MYGFWRGVADEAVARYLDCGVWDNGFARVRCRKCPEEFLVAFSCKERGLCPSCGAKRAAQLAAFLVDEVVEDVGQPSGSSFVEGSAESQVRLWDESRTPKGFNASDVFEAFGGVLVADGVRFSEIEWNADPNAVYGLDWVTSTGAHTHASFLINQNGEWISLEASQSRGGVGAWPAAERLQNQRNLRVYLLGTVDGASIPPY